MNRTETKCTVTRFTDLSSATRFSVDGQDVFLHVHGRVGERTEQLVLSTYDGHVLIRVYPVYDRRRLQLHLFDERNLTYLTLCPALTGISDDLGNGNGDGADAASRCAESIILLHKGQDANGAGAWRMVVNQAETVARVEEVGTGRTLMTMDNRNGMLWKRLGRTDCKRVCIKPGTDLAMMAFLAAAVEDICGEVLGRNLSLAQGGECQPVSIEGKW